MRNVYISALRGENLIPQDGKTCDPYIEIRIGDHSAKTEKQTQNHIDPKFTELSGFFFPWDGVSAMPAVEFFGWDYDYIGFDDFIGYARVPLHKSMLNSGSEIKVRLGIRDDGDKKLLNQYGTLGNLYFCLTDSPPAIGGTKVSPPGDALRNPQPRALSPTTAGGHQMYPTNPNNPHSVMNHQRLSTLEPGQKDIFVSNRIQRNSAVLGGGGGGSMAPDFAISSITLEGIPIKDGTPVFVVMHFLEDEEWRTNPVPAQRGFAQWMNLQFDVTKAFGQSLLRFSVVRRDEHGQLRTVVSGNSSPHPNTVGHETKILCVPPDQTFKQQTESSWGTITYFISNRQQLLRQQQPTPLTTSQAHPKHIDLFAVPPPPGGMYLRIIGATDLLPLDYNEDPDPFVVAHWDNGSSKGVQEVFRTQTLKSVKDPVWDEVQEVRNISRSAQKIVFTVFDQDPHGLDFAGTCEFDFLLCDPVGSFTFALYSRRDDPEVGVQDDATLRHFGREDFGTLTIEWNIDPAVQDRHQRALEEREYNNRALQHQRDGEEVYRSPLDPHHKQPQTHHTVATPPPHYLQPQQQHQQQPVANNNYNNPNTANARLKAHQPGALSGDFIAQPQQQQQQQYQQQQQQYAQHQQPQHQANPSAGPYPIQYAHDQHAQQNRQQAVVLLPPSTAQQQQQQPTSGYAPQVRPNGELVGRRFGERPIVPTSRAASPPPPNGPPQRQQQQQQGQLVRARQPAPPVSTGHGGVLVLTVLSIANINTRDGIAPYVRITYEDESKDNCAPDLAVVSEAVWNFKTEFYVADVSGGPQQLPPQQQQRKFVTLELCDGRNHSVYGAATIEVARQAHRSRNIVLPLFAPSGLSRPTTGASPPQIQQRGQQQQPQQFQVAELSCMIALNPVTLPRDIPINASAMLELTVVGAKSLNNSNKPNHHLHTNPYAIVIVQSRELGKIEYRSDVVQNSKHPKWFFSIPKRPVAPSDSVIVSIWDKDQDNFDDFLGQARFSVGTLVQSAATIELPLEGRPDARGGMMAGSATSRDASGLYGPIGGAGGQPQHQTHSTSSAVTTAKEGAYGSVTIEWAVTQQPTHNANDADSSAPHVVEVAVIEASHLARSQHNIAVVQLSVDERGSFSDQQQPFTRPVSKQSPRWDQTFVVQTIGTNTDIRFTVWDEVGRSGTFLGECVLATSSLKRAKERSETYTLQLRPRQDARYSRDDLALLNSSLNGLGSLIVEARIFSMQEYERRQREALRKQGKKYQLILQVAGTADIGPHGSYFVTIAAGGEERTSQVEVGTNVHFRNNFNFELHNPTEMVVLSLYSRSNIGRDMLVGDVAFPVKPPSAYETKPDEAWLTLRQSAGSAPQIMQQQQRSPARSGPYGYPSAQQQTALVGANNNINNGLGQPPRVFIRWRTFPDTTPAQGHGGDGLVALASPDGPMPTTVSELQQELRKAREDMLNMSSSHRGGAGHEVSPYHQQQQMRAHTPTNRQHSSRPFHVSVYISMNSQLMTVVGTEDSTARDVLQYCIAQLNTFDHAALLSAGGALSNQFSLSFRGQTFDSNDILSKYVSEKDVVLLGPFNGNQNQNSVQQQQRSPNVRELTQQYHYQQQQSIQRDTYTAPTTISNHNNTSYQQQQLQSLNNSRDVQQHHSTAPSSGQIEYINTRVLHRLQAGESSTLQTATIFLTTKESIQSSNVSWLVALCTQHRVAGFCHSDIDEDDGGRIRTQFLIQSDPRAIVGLLSDVFARNPFSDFSLICD
ncbi:Hypothetical protein, putative [Bodo saltans]|uniref:C2 domain-containing protein n=1 Tax=Bodo saltans TaxID=75058 RepID=A0A0S4J6G6_BODSA|nr:Hypothetical protein, putative [Bodo saltans]|eukprot:CUG69934.1 Hypothetical protein, putative [Bodo saltans]